MSRKNNLKLSVTNSKNVNTGQIKIIITFFTTLKKLPKASYIRDNSRQYIERLENTNTQNSKHETIYYPKDLLSFGTRRVKFWIITENNSKKIRWMKMIKNKGICYFCEHSKPNCKYQLLNYLNCEKIRIPQKIS